MLDFDHKESSFLLGLCITLGTIVIGLASFLFYTTYIPKESPRCEYNGWAYANGQIYDSTDGCNTCFCNGGNTVCTEKACLEKSPTSCVYNGITYNEGESFQSGDGCNTCGCNNGEVACTLMGCNN